MYTLALVKDNGGFDAAGRSTAETLRTEQFDESYGVLDNGCQSTIKLWRIAKTWLQEFNIQEGEGWVSVYEDGAIINQIT